MQFIRERSFYRQLAAIGIPVALQQLISVGVNLLDTVMLGTLGDATVSASALANQPFFILALFLFGVSSGSSVLIAQYWGRGDREPISRILATALRIALLFGALVFLPLFFCPNAVMRLFSEDPAVIALGAQYLRILAVSCVLSAFSSTVLNTMRSVESVRVPLFISCAAFAVNAFLNWVLIFGNLGAPAMGIRGSATATLCARVVEFALAAAFAFRFDQRIRLRLRDLFHIDRLLLRDFLHYSVPVVLNETMWGTGMTVQAAIIGHIGTEATAAYSIAGVLQRLVSVTFFGTAAATAVLTGKEIGAGRPERARNVAFTLLVVSNALGLLCGIVLVTLHGVAVGIYNVPDSTKQLASQLILVYAAVLFFQSLNTTSITGVLRSGGDTRYALVLDLTCLWFVALPLGALAGLVFHAPMALTFFLLFVDEPVKYCIGIARFRTGRWLRNVTRSPADNARLDALT